MMLTLVTSNELLFDIPQIAEFILVAFALGGLFSTVRQTSRDIKGLNDRYDKLEDRFLTAIEDLGANISNMTTELKTVLATHEVRLDHIEREKHV